MHLEFGARSDTGRVRGNNEDSFRLAPEQYLFVLSDGMGGQAHGEIASRMAAEAVVTHCREAERDPSLPLVGPRFEDLSERTNRLASAVRVASQLIYAAATENSEKHGMGATLVAVQFDDQRMSAAHVGDSRIYRLREGGLEQLTSDHSLVAEQVRRGMMTRREAEASAMQNVLLRALGVEPEIEVDANEHLMLDGDVVLLCSDGLTREVADVTIAEILAKTHPAQVAADHLVELANKAGGEDNVTVVVLRLAFHATGSLVRFGSWLKRTVRPPYPNGGR